ncbi:hypothetical protein K443DRAFT_147111 [Laccaria amethystina LaAM-08-1]|uniref:Uncharacterized protein n=1 Tax=Laccaria amethystina LaAM-08-1 TaxID=1095629 RepID=A0A0C9Y8I3_9AGAR|nr:hypothetical protein K443DRAFT_147111 [Laccaria amethystina LaAM-08-1]
MERTELTSVTNFALTICIGEKYDSIGSLAYEPTCNLLASLLTRGYRLLRTAPRRCGAGSGHSWLLNLNGLQFSQRKTISLGATSPIL